ncbi:Gfo/Idh/MocA family oxidoreductase [Paenibacillus rhizovicinus]|uniref:Gfo/Idh/MocA family oxidoreductase n=1 Tax=Paenibacillus rhizovicinus TaxID=2704463 RepID=A0A6C0NYI1_9BACL|nr:Gfo/Idh/MocA family oxidoreductase [Paenibacillus rhizovicinus]QHW31304.1 Gfo/Idh/MocA family oxidoreductase [Paenibacillus rhizovicinus]
MNSDNRIRIGLIGASWFTDLWFLPVLTRHPGVEVAAICSKNGANAQALADKYGIAGVYRSAEAMMDEAGLDGVCIVTPNDLHYPLTMAAIERGLHVLCEKPLGMDGGQTTAMRNAAEQAGIIHGVNFSIRQHPAVQYMRQAVADGRIGQLLEGRFEYSGDYGLSGPPGWRGSVQAGGSGGVLQDLGSHIIDLSQYILNDAIRAVQGSARCLESGRSVDFAERSNPDQAADSIAFLADFASGGHVAYQTSWVKPQGNNLQTLAIEIQGAEGSLKLISCGYGGQLQFGGPGRDWETIELPGLLPIDYAETPSEDRFRTYRNSPDNEAWRWADAILRARGDQSPKVELPDFIAGDRVQQVIDAIMASSETGRKVKVQ